MLVQLVWHFESSYTARFTTLIPVLSLGEPMTPVVAAARMNPKLNMMIVNAHFLSITSQVSPQRQYWILIRNKRFELTEQRNYKFKSGQNLLKPNSWRSRMGFLTLCGSSNTWLAVVPPQRHGCILNITKTNFWIRQVTKNAIYPYLKRRTNAHLESRNSDGRGFAECIENFDLHKQKREGNFRFYFRNAFQKMNPAITTQIMPTMPLTSLGESIWLPGLLVVSMASPSKSAAKQMMIIPTTTLSIFINS